LLCIALRWLCIASEGAGLDSDLEQLRFVRISLGSLNEIETLFSIAADLGLLTQESAEDLEFRARDLGVKIRNFARRIEADLDQAEHTTSGKDNAMQGNAKQPQSNAKQGV
jgi:hypothetical protein